MIVSSTPQFRCAKCNKLLAKNNEAGHYEIKCNRCGNLNNTFERMVEQVIITDKQGKILFINKAMEDVTGYTTNEVIGKKPSELWGGNMPKDFYVEMWKKMLEKKGSVKLTLKNKKKSGEFYNLELIVSPVVDTNGDILFFVGIEVVV